MAGPIAVLTVRISAQIAELQKSFSEATKATQKFQDSFAAVATAASTVGTFLGTVFSKIASSIASSLGTAIRDSIKYAQQFQNAFLGLGSVAAAFGVSANDATAAAKKLSADGLLPLRDAATGLKNLLAAGFNLEQSTKLMNAFKDSAAFGRAGALSFGDAVRSATEGVKNQNSILVDNAGVTKNLSVILREAGYQLQDLSDKTKGAGARQALYAGLLKETAAQAGDAAKASQTYSGAVAAIDTAYVSLLASLGEAVTKNKSVQIALAAVADALRGVQEWLGSSDQHFDIFSKTLSRVITVIANVIEAFDELQRRMAQIDKHVSGSVLNLVKGVSEIYVFLQKIEIQTQRPFRALGGERGAEASRLIETAKGNIREIEGFAAKMETSIAETQANSKKMTENLTPAVAKLRALAQEIDAAEGQMVELGAASTPATLDRGGLDTLTTKTKALGKELQLISQYEIVDAVQNAFGGIAGAGAGITPLDLILPGFESDIPVLDWSTMFDTDGLRQEAKLLTATFEDEMDNLPTQIRPVFEDLFAELPHLLRGVLSGGGGLGDVLVEAAALGANQFSEVFGKALARSLTPGGKALTGFEKGLGLAGLGLEGFTGGFDIGASQGKAKGALGGAGTGALSGFLAGGPIGAVIGGVGGLFGGLFGGGKKKKEERRALEESKRALAEQYGGMESLRVLAEKLGVDITKAFDAKKPEQFNAAVEELNQALEEQKTRIEGLNTALKGVNDRAALFADKFSKVFEATQGDDKGAAAKATKQLQALAQASEAEFAGLGLMIRDTFAGLVQETGSGIAALQQMAPAFQALEDGVSKWGITSTAVIDELRANFALVNNESFKPLFEQITATGEVLRGLFDAKALSPEGFQAIAADIGNSIQTIVNKGGDMAKTLALSQPVLQKLWEAQETYGEVTDETTQSILRQAEEQGLVGAHMKDVNEQILDVLLAIGKVLGADLPQAFEGLKQPASEAAASIEGSFNSIEIKPFTIGYKYDALNKPPSGVSVPHMASGGIVRRPTLALIGESGPEAVVPLTGSALGASATYETTIVLDGEKIARSSAKRLPKYMREMGIGR